MAMNDARFLGDPESLEAIIFQLGPRLKEEYDELKSLSLESCFPNRRMIIYTLRGGAPVDLSMILMGDMEMTRIGGPTVVVTDDAGPVVVGVLPVRWRNRDLFLHTPQNFIFKWKGKETTSNKIQFSPHYAMLIKTRSREHHQVEGHTYCVTLNKFRERFPAVPMRY